MLISSSCKEALLRDSKAASVPVSLAEKMLFLKVECSGKHLICHDPRTCCTEQVYDVSMYGG